MTTGYTAHLRVATHEWDVAAGDAPDYGPLGDVSFTWTAPPDDGWPTQHDPTVLTFGVVVEAGTDFDDVDQGATVHFTFTPDGYPAPLLEFGGTVRDLTARPHPRGMLYELTAVDHLQALQEEYTTQTFLPSATPADDIWGLIVQDAGGVGGGLGTRPALPDPLDGTDPPNSGGFVGVDTALEGSTWDVLTRFAAAMPFRLGATPFRQRVLLSYQLDPAGDLDATQPFLGTWVTQDADDMLATAVDGCFLPTDAVEWSRPRTEPNVVRRGGFEWTRPHTGVDIVLELDDPGEPFSQTDPEWIIDGVEAASQWATVLRFAGSHEPATVAGWFTFPAALRTLVTCTGIDPRHTPDGLGTYAGMLAGATLVIPPGGRWHVDFTLRRTLPAS